jgi:predicted DNA-binding transcriptional regulator AlpA
MSNEDHIWFDEHGEINQGRVHNGNLFASNLDRSRCIRAGLNERQWLKDHPGVWRPLEDVLREAAAWKRRVEGPVETIATGPSSQIPSDIRKDGKDVDGAASVEIPPGDPSPPHPPTLTKAGSKTVPAPSESDFDAEIQIGTRRYVSADRFATMRGISRKTLSRRIAAGKVPPSIKIGNKLFFEVSDIRGGPASDESDPAH